MFRKSLIRYPVTTREILIEQSLASSKVNKTGKILTRHSPITFISFSPFLQIFYRSLGQRTGGEGSIPANYAAVFEKWSVRLAWVFDPTHRPIQAAWANLRISSTRVRRTVIYLREDRFQKRGPRVMNERAEQVWGARPPIQASSRTRSRKGKKLLRWTLERRNDTVSRSGQNPKSSIFVRGVVHHSLELTGEIVDFARNIPWIGKSFLLV